jgi:hypothetical protein
MHIEQALAGYSDDQICRCGDDDVVVQQIEKVTQ